jgi:ribonuclease BN (tRNA processing enzyme)
MDIKVTILGSGTCVPRLQRSSCAVLVETGQAKILLDLGMGTIRRLLEYGVSIFDLTHIGISHFHPDHTAEWVPLIFATKFPDGNPRAKPLTVLGGTGLKGFYAGLQAAFGQWIVLPQGQMQIREIDTLAGETLEFDDFRLTARPVNHRPESLAYRIESRGGHSVVYSGDTDECDALPSLAEGTDLFICESALPDELKASGHLTPSLAGRYARQARVERLVLTHLYPQCDDADIVKQAQSIYKGPVIAAEDLMSFIFS